MIDGTINAPKTYSWILHPLEIRAKKTEKRLKRNPPCPIKDRRAALPISKLIAQSLSPSAISGSNSEDHRQVFNIVSHTNKQGADSKQL
tara:strand:- start:494 stop:760 length:267 start_codon:yes stop_codon:yes gene_type:complete